MKQSREEFPRTTSIPTFGTVAPLNSLRFFNYLHVFHSYTYFY